MIRLPQLPAPCVEEHEINVDLLPRLFHLSPSDDTSALIPSDRPQTRLKFSSPRSASRRYAVPLCSFGDYRLMSGKQLTKAGVPTSAFVTI